MSAQPTPLYSDNTTSTAPMRVTYELSDEQLAAFRIEIVREITETLAVHWLPREPLTPDELCAYLGGIHRETLRRWTDEGAIDAWRYGHTTLYLPDQIARFLGRDGQS